METETYSTYTLGKKVVTPWNEVPFGDHSYSICLWVLKVGWLAAFMVVLCIVHITLFNAYFGKFAMTFIEIGCMNIPKCHWMVIVVNLVKWTWLFAWCCLWVWFCVYSCHVLKWYVKLEVKKRADLSPGSEVLTPLNRLPVTRAPFY